VLCLLGACAPAAAQDYPTRPIRALTATSAGGTSDVFMRVLGEEVRKRWGQPIVVENRPGGAMNVGGRACADAPNDGYTICILPPETLAYNQFLFKQIPYDPAKDFVPITNPFFAAVHGTFGGKERINGKTVTGIDPNTVAHTFTIHGLVTNQPWLFVSVPLPQVPPNAPDLANNYPAPMIVTFQFVTGGPGHYVWQCEYPCGISYMGFGGPMSTEGYMTGTLTVS